MASAFTHAFVGLALGNVCVSNPVPRRFWILAALCPALPDIDFIGFYFGVAYGSPLGHRGFTHSLLFAWLLGFLVATCAFSKERFTARWFWTWVFFCMITATHGALDAMSNGGMGIGFYIPFSNERYFFPWTPIEVSPLSPRAFFSAWGVRVIASELVWVWLPLSVVVAGVRVYRNRSAPPT